jgi:uncharacterized protein (TIRG00374 family)
MSCSEVMAQDPYTSGVRSRSPAVTELAEGDQPAAGPPPTKATGRGLRNGIISLVVFSGLAIGLLFAVPGLHAAEDRITDADPLWITLAVVFEVLSCLGYVVLFEVVFGKLGGRLQARLALSELAVNSVVSGSGLGGIALGVWVLRSKGIPMERIAKRSVAMFMLTSVVNAGAVVLIGVPMWLGLISGKRDPLLTLLPAAISLAAIFGTLSLAVWAGHLAARMSTRHKTVRVILNSLADGVAESLSLMRTLDWRLLGALGYWLFDNLVLYVVLVGFGEHSSFWVVGMAYLVGMLANSLPIPGGFLAIEGGLVGMLVLFGVHPVSVAIAAVITYRAISLWLPSIVGTLAFLSMRREIGTPIPQTEAPAATG